MDTISEPSEFASMTKKRKVNFQTTPETRYISREIKQKKIKTKDTSKPKRQPKKAPVQNTEKEPRQKNLNALMYQNNQRLVFITHSQDRPSYTDVEKQCPKWIPPTSGGLNGLIPARLTPRCYVCNKLGHIYSECTAKKKNNNLFCFKCGYIGDSMDDCAKCKRRQWLKEIKARNKPKKKS